MCLTIPGRVLAVSEPQPGVRSAQVDFRGLVRTANLLYAPEVAAGDYVIVQAGFVIRRLAEAEALEALEYTRQIDAMEGAKAPSVPDVDRTAPKSAA